MIDHRVAIRRIDKRRNANKKPPGETAISTSGLRRQRPYFVQQLSSDCKAPVGLHPRKVEVSKSLKQLRLRNRTGDSGFSAMNPAATKGTLAGGS
jgi:hypothetical protein